MGDIDREKDRDRNKSNYLISEKNRTEIRKAQCYSFAAGFAALVNFPLWKAQAIGQAGFELPTKARGFWHRYRVAVQPPYKGILAAWLGMTWSRSFIFYGSDIGKRGMMKLGYEGSITSVIPALCLSGMAQCINNPIFRATIILQDPKCQMRNVPESLSFIYKKGGIRGLWHGTSAGIMKTAPKYASAVLVKDVVEELLIKREEKMSMIEKHKHKHTNDNFTVHPQPVSPQPDQNRLRRLQRASIKSIAAGLAGAMITNPFDVIRADMFKSDRKFSNSFQHLWKTHGIFFVVRGVDKNMVAVTVPVTITLFVADTLESIYNE